MRRYPSIPLEGATVIVTGGARGIGRATAELFHERGATVHLGDIDLDPAEDAARSIGPKAFAAHLDVTSAQSWKTFLDGVVARSGRIDVLVNNAGVMPLGAFDEEDDAISRLTLNVNVLGPINGMKAVLPLMTATGRGHIVNIASMAGKMPFPGMVVYNASKYGAVGLTASARVEYSRSSVSISAVLPSAVRTELSSGVSLGAGLPTVDPEDIARAVLGTMRSRRAETPVPRYLSVWNRFGGLVPELVLDLGRRALNDRRGLDEIDEVGRKAYTDRVSKQAI
ncbi:MAG: SDR family oxidoreductase [Actinomycetota bacterium]|nr:SDR family oxidoreductase [Actinomycetota bacterium]